ncbi:MAG: SMC family ATPase, partial [Acidimicrobiia bacterium]|nr:SMC family ATPase [Acidimicrobiia bacterium]
MRPIRITLEGFRSHRGRTVLDFDGRSLVGIVGPNGSGKSSLLDGVAYALYGRTPSDGRGGQKLINARAEAARVELWFRTSGEVYRVTRLQRRKGTAQQALERWDEVDGTKLETVADKKADIGDAVEALVGLDFEAFARSALLAQNRFADLLTAPPAEAAKVLTGLFGFGMIEEMRRVASRRLGEVQAQLQQVQQAQTTLATVRQQADDAARRATDAEAARARLTELVEAVAGHDEAIGLADAELAGLAERGEALTAAAGALPGVKDREAALERVEAHATRVADATARAESAKTAAIEAKEAVDQALADDLPGAISRLASAIERASEMGRRLGDAQRAVAGAEQDLTRARARSEAAATTAEAATAAVEAARSAASEAADALRGLEQGHAAHLLAEGLAPGDPCPVCTQTVDEVPELPEPGGLDEARLAASDANAALRTAEEAAAAAGADLARTTAEMEAATSAVAGAEQARDEAHAAHVVASEALG